MCKYSPKFGGFSPETKYLTEEQEKKVLHLRILFFFFTHLNVQPKNNTPPTLQLCFPSFFFIFPKVQFHPKQRFRSHFFKLTQVHDMSSPLPIHHGESNIYFSI